MKRQAWTRCKAASSAFWDALSAHERRLVALAGAVVALALVYALLLAPAFHGRAQLAVELPLLRQQAAQLQALAKEAGALSGAAPAPVAALSREALTSSLAAHGLTAQSVSVTGEYAKLQLKGASFADLIDWLEAQRVEGRIVVQEANIVAQASAGQVDATLTLHQSAGGLQ
jgi:general secretion pathway protein M